MFGLAPKKGDDGQLSWTFPMGTRSWPASRPKTSARSPTASSRPATQYIGKTVGIMGEALTIEQMGKKCRKVLGVGPVKYNAVEADVYRGFGFPAPTRWATCSRPTATSRRK